MSSSELGFFRQYRELLCCPRCGGDLDVSDEVHFVCRRGDHRYPVQGGVPSLFTPNDWEDSRPDVTDTMRAFYDAHPFPDYELFDDAASLIARARTGVVAKLLDDRVPCDARVLECGCGTGQLTNFLSLANRTVIGTDLSLNSLKIATAFKQRNALDHAHFVQMNLFRPAFKAGTFDLVVANGVLHHTSDPFRGYKAMSALVRPGGHIVIGLYHKYGRLATGVRRCLIRATNSRVKLLDGRAVDPDIGAHKRSAWFIDQYMNPHESTHTANEVAGWLGATGFEFVRAIPNTLSFAGLTDNEDLFAPAPPGNAIDRLLTHIGMILRGHRDGGFFIVIGARRELV
jgi:SAM-dependent methyltransferase